MVRRWQRSCAVCRLRCCFLKCTTENQSWELIKNSCSIIFPYVQFSAESVVTGHTFFYSDLRNTPWVHLSLIFFLAVANEEKRFSLDSLWPSPQHTFSNNAQPTKPSNAIHGWLQGSDLTQQFAFPQIELFSFGRDLVISPCLSPPRCLSPPAASPLLLPLPSCCPLSGTASCRLLSTLTCWLTVLLKFACL